MKNNKYLIFLCLLLVVFCVACNKEKFLDAKPDQSKVTPETLEDFQALLDNDTKMNGSSFGLMPVIGLISSDDYYVTDANYGSSLAYERNAYIWAKDIYSGEEVKDWGWPYRAVFYANVVLDGLEQKAPAANEQVTWDNLKGSALFYRAYMFYHLAQVYAPQYKAASAATDLGIPLRLKSDINEDLRRATVQQCYERIIADIKMSIPLLPVNPLYKTRPSKPAAFALLANTYLIMQDYQNSFNYADSCLKYRNTLVNYNSLSKTASFPFKLFNDEVIFQALLMNNFTILGNSFAKIDIGFYQLYANDDLRKQLYFRLRSPDVYTFKNSYNENARLFCGLAVDEMKLVRAECYARLGNTAAAMNDLNELLAKRFVTNAFVPLVATNPEDALRIVLLERRKELVMRGTRWADLRRLNLDPRFAITLTRVVQGQTYTLLPNDKRYTLPIPDNVIALNPKIQQTER